MSNDLVARAHRALGPVAPRKDQPAGPVDLQGAELLARARAAISAPSKQTLVVATPSPPPPLFAEKVKLLMTCSARGVSYVVNAERRGDNLLCVDHEMPQPGKSGPAQSPGLLSGRYQIEANGWRCPVCHHGDAIWVCNCERKGAMHCGGSFNGLYRCVCGRNESRQFVDVKDTQVRGASVASTPRQFGSGDQRGHQPQLKQVGYERS